MVDTAAEIATNFLAQVEGFRARPYADAGHVWTYGYGFTSTPSGTRVSASTPMISEPDARQWLETLVSRTLNTVRNMCKLSLNANQEAALTSFAYNVGTGALRTSTLLKMVNDGDFQEASKQFMAWTYAGGRVVSGLINRRKAEMALFNTPDATPPMSEADKLDAQYNPTLNMEA
jgi:lysozyme